MIEDEGHVMMVCQGDEESGCSYPQGLVVSVCCSLLLRLLVIIKALGEESQATNSYGSPDKFQHYYFLLRLQASAIIQAGLAVRWERGSLLHEACF